MSFLLDNGYSSCDYNVIIELFTVIIHKNGLSDYGLARHMNSIDCIQTIRCFLLPSLVNKCF